MEIVITFVTPVIPLELLSKSKIFNLIAFDANNIDTQIPLDKLQRKFIIIK